MSTGWPMKSIKIEITEELWREIENYAEQSNSHILTVPSRLIRAGLEATYAKHPNLGK